MVERSEIIFGAVKNVSRYQTWNSVTRDKKKKKKKKRYFCKDEAIALNGPCSGFKIRQRTVVSP